MASPELASFTDGAAMDLFVRGISGLRQAAWNCKNRLATKNSFENESRALKTIFEFMFEFGDTASEKALEDDAINILGCDVIGAIELAGLMTEYMRISMSRTHNKISIAEEAEKLASLKARARQYVKDRSGANHAAAVQEAAAI